MKSLKFTGLLTLFFIAIFFISCDKDNTAANLELAELSAIKNSTEKINIEPEELPATSLGHIEDFYFETYIESAARVVGKGYEVELANQDFLYFRENGTEIRDLRSGDRPLRPGPCGRGRLVDISTLPDNITQYVADNYPDADILRAKRQVDRYLVLISGRTILVFDYNGEFIHVSRIFYHCDQHNQGVSLDDLPDSVIQYISDHCPECEILRAAIVRNKLVVGTMANGSPAIFVFTMDGEFLYMRG